MGQPFVDDETARTGVLEKLQASGGELPMRDLHRFSLLKFARGHQAFSLLMEGLVADGLVEFDDGVFMLTEKAKGAQA